MKPKHCYLSVWLLLGCWMFALPVQGAGGDTAAPAKHFHLLRAVMCESIENYEPNNVGVAFSIDVGKVSCYTAFDGVADTTYIQHKWYRRDELVTAKRLTLKPPSWATYSSIQLREDDKGPWRVEIWDAHDRLIKTLRFSIVD